MTVGWPCSALMRSSSFLTALVTMATGVAAASLLLWHDSLLSCIGKLWPADSVGLQTFMAAFATISLWQGRLWLLTYKLQWQHSASTCCILLHKATQPSLPTTAFPYHLLAMSIYKHDCFFVACVATLYVTSAYQCSGFTSNASAALLSIRQPSMFTLSTQFSKDKLCGLQ